MSGLYETACKHCIRVSGDIQGNFAQGVVIFKNKSELTKYLSELIENKNKLLSFGLRSKNKSLEFDIDSICNRLTDIITKE